MLLETSPARELADIRTVLCAYFPLLFDIAAAFGTLDDRSNSAGSSQSGDFLIVKSNSSALSPRTERSKTRV
jgi:hypothetical protein